MWAESKPFQRAENQRYEKEKRAEWKEKQSQEKEAVPSVKHGKADHLRTIHAG
jgi:hypothetical protein